MDPELQGDQNEEYKPPSDLNAEPTRADPPELRDNTGKDLTDPNPADEEGVPEGDVSQGQNQSESRTSNQRGQTKSGQPDMRLKENQNQEVSGQS